MSKDTCTYHETKPAVWHCGDCIRHFCNRCVVTTTADPAGPPRCALCRAPLAYLGGGNAAQPFWSVAHRFFTYPLSGSGLTFMAVLAFLALLLPAGMLAAVFVVLLCVAVTVKYCFAVLEAVAMGATRPPSVIDAVSGDEDHLFLKFMGLLIVVGFVQGVAEVLVHPAVGAAVSLAVTLAMPAMIILLAVNRKVGEALSPTRLAMLMARIGWPYVLAVFLTNVISTGPFLAAMYMPSALVGNLLALSLFAALVGYFAVVNFAMLGYLIYEHQGSLGYVAGDPEDERLDDSPESRRHQLLGEVNVLVKESRQEEALERLHGRRAAFANDLTFHQRHFELAVQHGDPAAVARAAEPYLERLMSRDGVDQALDVWRRAARADATYRPSKPAICHTLAEHAYAANLEREALALLVNLHKRAPDYADLAGAYGLAAALLREQGRDDKAQELDAFTEAFLARRAQQASAGASNLTLSSLR